MQLSRHCPNPVTLIAKRFEAIRVIHLKVIRHQKTQFADLQKGGEYLLLGVEIRNGDVGSAGLLQFE